MVGFGFGTLALLVIVGLAGPLLAAVPRLRVPVVVGELFAGIVVGKTGFGVINPDEPTFQLLASVGFALVMFAAGTHVPVRDKALRGDVPRALLRAIAVGAVAAVLGVAVARVFGTGHALLYGLLMASSSAALALPVIESLGLGGPQVLATTTQIAIADASSIVLLPLVINPSGAPRAAAGALAVAAAGVVLFFVLRHFEQSGARKSMHRYSETHRLALELRVSMILLFTLAALAVGTHVSIMLAGFALGLVVGAVGEPRRLARQLFGITEGFFGPLFFVWLGASLQVRDLATKPAFVGLGVALGLGAVLAHLTGRLMAQPLSLATLAAAQMGVPVAAATLGTEQHLLAPGEPSALILGALITVVITTIAGVRAARHYSGHPGAGAP